MNNDPIEQFRRLYNEAEKTLPEPDAMVLSTVDEDGSPSGRFVLLKAVDGHGFVFYTNLSSRKARALIANPRAALCFYWPTINKQIRVEGVVERVSDAEADEYFSSRPRESQIGAWASAQSDTLPSRQLLEDRVADVRKRFEGKPVTRPEFWSGFRVVPGVIEFWTRDAARLHHRERFSRLGERWVPELLYP